MARNLSVRPRKLRKEEYDNYRMTQDVITAIFKNSVKQHIENMPTGIPSIRLELSEESYAGIKICDIPLETIKGCGVLATATALYRKPSRRQIIEIAEMIQANDYYLKGKGLYWQWFDNFCKRASHWLNIITALENKEVVTVLVNLPEGGRGFTNIVGYFQSKDSENNSEYNHSFKLLGLGWWTLEELIERLETAPWVWNV